ncbi:hypothetical protein Y032_0022g508 [Ancylostoma ceylanicum]|uniref:Uncharacterized protein n=1 Tax=Ancylostoma ceylanicum TaxID=53326 RepID=A0A016V0E1_9BILA|nr:hypothetical protein Y032_0022g508 [Ancylostoma ceylanicum]
MLCDPRMPDRAFAVRPTDVRSLRWFAAHAYQVAAVLCGPQMPDRGDVVIPRHDTCHTRDVKVSRPQYCGEPKDM